MSATLQDDVLATLDGIHDPCSIATRRPLSIVELGLLVDLTVSPDNEARVVLRATSPSCVLIGSIMGAVEERVRAVPGVRNVVVELDVSSDWYPERMTPAGAAKLEIARHQARRSGTLR
ncbi:MAG: iron-sulfur cluster assembly protein [Nocardioides sp.]|uniref:metal-sulfur cluster assembly factor n=1 Tax=Nocardioides sp. TaxID=35761 RepID=UPI0039E5E309